MVPRTPILLMALAPLFCIYAQSAVNQMGWNNVTVPVAMLVMVFFILAISAVLFLVFHKEHRDREVSSRYNNDLFNEGVGRLGLNSSETDRLKKLLTYENVLQPQTILQSVSLFERCIDTEVRSLLGARIPDVERKAEDNFLRGLRKKLGFHLLPFEHPLVSTRNITIGQVGSIFGKNINQAIIKRTVLVENNEFFFTLGYNPDKEDPVGLTPGNRIRFVFSRQGDGVYGIEVELAHIRNGRLDFLHTLEIKRNQLRQFVRIEMSGDVKFRMVKTPDPEKSELKRGESSTGKIADLSGGGMSFLSPISLKPGDLITLTFKAGDKMYTALAGKVVRISLQEGKNSRFFRHHIQFQEMEPRKREEIVRYVFEKQRQMNQWR